MLNHMVDNTPTRPGSNSTGSTDLDAVFQALSDPTRRAMLRELTAGERSVGELAAPFDMTLAAASKHIKSLERAGLVRRTVQGRTHVCRLDAAPLHAGHEWLRHYERFWNRSLDALEALLRESSSEQGGSTVPKRESAPAALAKHAPSRRKHPPR